MSFHILPLTPLPPLPSHYVYMHLVNITARVVCYTTKPKFLFPFHSHVPFTLPCVCVEFIATCMSYWSTVQLGYIKTVQANCTSKIAATVTT